MASLAGGVEQSPEEGHCLCSPESVRARGPRARARGRRGPGALRQQRPVWLHWVEGHPRDIAPAVIPGNNCAFRQQPSGSRAVTAAPSCPIWAFRSLERGVAQLLELRILVGQTPAKHVHADTGAHAHTCTHMCMHTHTPSPGFFLPVGAHVCIGEPDLFLLSTLCNLWVF